MTPADTLLPRLHGVRPTGHERWIARCPAHDDKRPSLSIKVGDTGALLIYCWAGCSIGEIASAAGVNVIDLFPRRYKSDTEPPTNRKPFRQRLANGLAPLVANFQADLMVTHVLLSDVGQGKPISDLDQQAARAAATRVWSVLLEAQHVL